jgi:type II secretory pathway pseudopilin PulG
MRSRSTFVAVVAVLAAALLTSGCGGSTTTNAASTQPEVQAQLAQARADGARSAREEDRLRRLEQQVRDQNKSAAGGSNGTTSSSSSSSQGTTCPGTSDLTVGPVTSCAFAQNVRDAYDASGASGGPNNFEVYSPTTKQIYSMFCTGGSPHHCTGGNNASVSFP